MTTELRNAAHNPEVVGSNPSPATKKVPKTVGFRNFLFYSVQNSYGFITRNLPRPYPRPKSGNARKGQETAKPANRSTPRNNTAPPSSISPLFFVFCDAFVKGPTRFFIAIKFTPQKCRVSFIVKQNFSTSVVHLRWNTRSPINCLSQS